MDTSDPDLFCDDFIMDLICSSDLGTNGINTSEDSLTTLIETLKNGNDFEERLRTAQTLVQERMPTMPILVIDNQILKHLLPALKEIHLKIFKNIENVIDHDAGKLPEKLHTVQIHLQMCINVLELLDGVLASILKNTQFGLCDVQSLPLNVIEMLLITFQHFKKSDSFYKGCSGDLKEFSTVIKLAYVIHEKVLMLIVERTHISEVSEEMVSLLKDVLRFLVKIGEVLICMNLKGFADNWRGYMGITQKFSTMLNEHSFSIKEAIDCLSTQIEESFVNALNKYNTNVQNVYTIIRRCNFLMKIIFKLCELFLWNSEMDWEAVLKFLLTVYKYYPSLLLLKGCPENVCFQIKCMVFSEVDILLEQLCCKTEFYKTLQKTKETQLPSPNGFLLFTFVFKNLCAIIKSNPTITKSVYIHFTVARFFDTLQKGYCEFWEIVIAASDDKNNTLYDDNVKNLAYIILSENSEEYNQIENILLKNVFADSAWNSLLAVDIWCMVLRAEKPKFRYETLCNIIEQTKFLLVDDVSRPQLIFLKNLIQRTFGMLSEAYTKMLLDKYPLYQNLRLWEILGFKHFPKTEVIAIAAEIINVVHKTNLFLSRKCNLEDFKMLCVGLDTIASIPKHPELDSTHLILSLYNLWQFVFENMSYDSYYLKCFIYKLIAITNNFLLDFNNEKLLLILGTLRQLLNSNVTIQILATTILSTLSKKSITKSPEQHQIYAIISEIFYQLLTDKNPIIKQNVLEVFLQFSKSPQHHIITQNSIKDDELQMRLSNFLSCRVHNGTLSTGEYFRLQSKYEFSHCCLTIPKLNGRHNDIVDQKKIPAYENEINATIKRIKTDVELFYRLSGNQHLAHESVIEIMRILNC